MLRWLRFLLYSGFLWFSLIAHGAAIRQSLRLVSSHRYFAPEAACVPCALFILAFSLAFAVWLAGATIAGWRLPVPAYAAPIGLLIFTLLHGPLLPPRDRFADQGPAERARAAMKHLVQALSAQGEPPCAASPESHERLLSRSAEVPMTGFRAFGRPVPFSVVVEPSSDGPVRERRPDDGVGVVYLACDPMGRRFWLSALVADAFPVGRPTLLRDGVGKVVYEEGEVAAR
jgi:hypothetical protein